MTAIMIVAYCLSTAATVAIAVYAVKSHRLADKSFQLAQEIRRANELKARSDDEFRQQVSDLYRAIVVSELIAAQGPAGMCSTMEGRLNYFREYYKGQTPIFD